MIDGNAPKTLTSKKWR